MPTAQRCAWPGDNPLYLAYHDEEWGVPLHDDRRLFEFLILDGFQAGLSWLTILRKRDNFRQAFDHFAGVTSHVPLDCNYGATSMTLTPSSGNTYYLVVPHNGVNEGSYGVDSNGVERPAAIAACYPQSVGYCW